MTRSYTLDNWDGHLSKFEAHKLPQALRGQPLTPPLDDSSLPPSATGDLQRPVIFSPNYNASVVEGSLNYGRSNSHQPTDDASNEHLSNTMPHQFQKTPLFDLSDSSDTDLTSDIVTDTLNPPPSATRDNDRRSPSISRSGTHCFSVFSPNPPTLVPSPALTVQTISTYTADAFGEEEDDDVIIVNHIHTSSSSRDIPLDEAPTSDMHDSLFTPPLSDDLSSTSAPPLNHSKKSWPRVDVSPAARKIRIVASHVLVPLLSKPKSEYINWSKLFKPARKRPRRTAQDGLKDVLHAVWENNERLGWLGEDDDDDGRRKKRKRKHKPREGSTCPAAGPSQRSHDGEGSVIFVNRTPIVKHLVDENQRPVESTFIDLTLSDDEEVKPLSAPTPSVTQVTEETSPNRQLVSEELQETRISVGVVHSISYKTLLHNTRFLRCTKDDTDLPNDFVMLDSLLPFRRRRALLDQDLEVSSSLVDEFSLGFPVLTEFGLTTFDEHYSDDSVDDFMELFGSSSEPAVPKPDVGPGTPHPPPTLDESLACLPKIDLAAKYRKKKTAASRRTSVLTPRKGAPVQPSRTPASSFRNRPVQDMVIDDDGYDPHTPLVPSAKALGKRKAVESPLQAMQPHPDVQSLFPSSRTAESIPTTTPAADNSFDSYINYWPTSPGRPMTLISDNPSLHLGDTYTYPDPYSNLSLSSVPNLNFVDYRHHQYPTQSVEPPPAASLLYHSDDYSGTPDDFGCFPGSVLGDPPPPSESTLLPSWSPGLDTGFYNGTVNPSLLSGGLLGMPEQYPESSFPDVGIDPEKESESHFLSTTHSPTHSPSPVTLSSSPKSRSLHPVHVRMDTESDTIFVRHRGTTTPGDSPNDSKRRHVQRPMPDMVPSAILSLSSSSSSSSEDEEKTDGVSKRRSTKPRGGGVRSTLSNHVQTKTNTRAKVARKAGANLPAGLNLSEPTVVLGGQPWQMQEKAAYCHQCRNRTMVLKLECGRCKKLFCIRCLTLRYPDEPRALQMKDAGCPVCLDYCNCTICCKKRGVQYISTKDALAGGVASQARLTAQKRAKPPLSGASHTSSISLVPELGIASHSRPSTPPAYSRVNLSPSGGVYWGAVYGADGSKIGKSFSFAKEDVRERGALAVPKTGEYWGVVYGADGSRIGKSYTVAKGDVGRIASSAASAKSVPERGTTTVQSKKTRQRRVYVGMIHPSWQFDGAVKKSVLDPVPPSKKVHESRRPRKYVGNKAFLFYKSERMARELADLSPLSSLEEDWDEEDRGMDVEEEDDWDMIGIVGNAGNAREASNDGSAVSSRSLCDQDVVRAIGLSLHACGIQLAG